MVCVKSINFLKILARYAKRDHFLTLVVLIVLLILREFLPVKSMNLKTFASSVKKVTMLSLLNVLVYLLKIKSFNVSTIKQELFVRNAKQVISYRPINALKSLLKIALYMPHTIVVRSAKKGIKFKLKIKKMNAYQFSKKTACNTIWVRKESLVSFVLKIFMFRKPLGNAWEYLSRFKTVFIIKRVSNVNSASREVCWT